MFWKGFNEQKMKKRWTLLIIVAMVIISAIWIIIRGNTYIFKEKINKNVVNDISQIDLSIENDLSDDEVIKITEKNIEDDYLVLNLEAVKKGKVDIVLRYSNGQVVIVPVYVHDFNIISIRTFFGDSRGSVIIPIFIELILCYVLFNIIKKYNESMNNNIYQYKNILYMGLIIFLIFCILNQLIIIIEFNGLDYAVEGTIDIANFISFLVLPVAFVVSIFVTISNIVLLKREGMNYRNALGIILGVFLCFLTISPDILYNMLYSVTWIDIHNEQGIGTYIYLFVEAMIYMIAAYIECILMGTIILGVKAAKRIPNFDKDYIIILGCKIKKDGTLTNLLKGRTDRAIEFSKMQLEKNGKQITFVPSGGKGNDEVVAEGVAIKNYLLEQGIDEKDILLESNSKNTYENVKYSYALIKKQKENANIAFSTTNYHVFRAGVIATDQNITIEGIGAKTKQYFWINAFIREFIATLYSEKKKHLLILAIISISELIMIGLLYFSNNIH